MIDCVKTFTSKPVIERITFRLNPKDLSSFLQCSKDIHTSVHENPILKGRVRCYLRAKECCVQRRLKETEPQLLLFDLIRADMYFGRLAEAYQKIILFELIDERSEMLASLAVHYAWEGNPVAAGAIFKDAFVLINSKRENHLFKLALLQIQAELFEDVPATLAHMPQSIKDKVFSHLVAKQVETGQIDQAYETIEKIENSVVKYQAFFTLSAAERKAGTATIAFNRAIHEISKIAALGLNTPEIFHNTTIAYANAGRIDDVLLRCDTYQSKKRKAKAYNEGACAFAKQGLSEIANDLFDLALQTTKLKKKEESRNVIFGSIIEKLTEAEYFDLALTTINLLPNGPIKECYMQDLGEGLVSAGQIEQAFKLAQTPMTKATQTIILVHITLSQSRRKKHEEALSTLNQLCAIENTLDGDKDSHFAFKASIEAASGLLDQAFETLDQIKEDDGVLLALKTMDARLQQQLSL